MTKKEQPSIFEIAPEPVVDSNPYFTQDATREDKQHDADERAAVTDDDRQVAAKRRAASYEHGLVGRSAADPRIVRADS